jgi:tripartite-type tricarboxylate transporter receptor subunit TctC
MQYSVQSGTRVLTVGNKGRLAITELVPTGEENGPPARLTAKFNPATAAGLSDGQITMCKAETGSHLAETTCRWRTSATGCTRSGFQGGHPSFGAFFEKLRTRWLRDWRGLHRWLAPRTPLVQGSRSTSPR